MKVLVTGADGFLGSNFIEQHTFRATQIHAWVRNIDSFTAKKNVFSKMVDIRDRELVLAEVRKIRPDLILHLAAKSLPVQSWEDTTLCLSTNILGTLNILDAIIELDNKPKFLFMGSSAEYSEPVETELIHENHLRIPDSPYAASKITCSDLTLLYGLKYALDVVILRPFSITGPGKPNDVYNDFARRIAAIERKENEYLRVGNLNVYRDILDVRDFVSAIEHVIQFGNTGNTYNICSGEGVRLQKIIELYEEISCVNINVKQNKNLLRSIEHKIRIGDPSKLLALGWSNKHTLKETLENVLDFWRIYCVAFQITL